MFHDRTLSCLEPYIPVTILEGGTLIRVEVGEIVNQRLIYKGH